jgi:hypothetical protein
MVETFYRTNILEEQRDEKTEYYSLALFAVAANFFTVSKHHGFWSEELQHPVLNRIVFNTLEEPLSFAEAEKAYAEQRAYLARTGFVHAISYDYSNDRPTHEDISPKD